MKNQIEPVSIANSVRGSVIQIPSDVVDEPAEPAERPRIGAPIVREKLLRHIEHARAVPGLAVCVPSAKDSLRFGRDIPTQSGSPHAGDGYDRAESRVRDCAVRKPAMLSVNSDFNCCEEISVSVPPTAQ